MSKIKKVVLLGLGVTGEAMAHYFLQMDYHVTVVDDVYRKETIDKGVAFSKEYKNFTMIASPKHKIDLDSFDFAILSPSYRIKSSSPICGSFNNIYSELEYFSQFMSESFTIALTGTDGKTTAVKLLTHILEVVKKSVFLGGNVGIPLVNYITNSKKYDIVVLELSSFQLFYTKNFTCNIGVILNIAQDHVTWHSDEREYLLSKCKIIDFSKDNYYIHTSVTDELNRLSIEKERVVINYSEKNIENKTNEINNSLYYEKNSYNKDYLHSTKKGEIVFSNGDTWDLSTLPKNKRILVENLPPLADICRKLGLTKEQFYSGVESFKLEPYRLTENYIDGKLFINDSKSTNIHSTLFALKNYQNSILILGGDDKKLNYSDYISGIKEFGVKEIICFGGLKDKLFSILEPHFKCKKLSTLNDVFDYLKKETIKDDITLFSPGSSSFDLYKDYKHRGAHFDELLKNYFSI